MSLLNKQTTILCRHSFNTPVQRDSRTHADADRRSGSRSDPARAGGQTDGQTESGGRWTLPELESIFRDRGSCRIPSRYGRQTDSPDRSGCRLLAPLSAAGTDPREAGRTGASRAAAVERGAGAYGATRAALWEELMQTELSGWE